ncbi:MAG: sugar ABC transporter ATP-binding protein [Verrucomicrobiales bacterium]|nr:sugar ABC transporter ATP-binding protein [Verrucomicrobiales bacterium]
MAPPPLLEMRGIAKAFPGVQALRGVSLQLRAGEVLALLGENGAGKSTLMKILGGAHLADRGSLSIAGQQLSIASPADSRAAGIAIIYQEFNLIPALNAVENIFLGQEQVRMGFITRASERSRAADLFAQLGVDLDLDTPCRRLTTAQQQLVEIAKALALNARIIVMDEPSAALTSHEVDRLFQIIRELKAKGIGIVYISHRLEEIFTIADRVQVLRDGADAGERLIGDLDRHELIRLMVGRELTDEFPKRASCIGEPVLEAIGLRRGSAVRDVSLTLRRGEILALTGLVGSGRTETVRLLFGADQREQGIVRVRGQERALRTPCEAIAAGIGFLTEDRKLQGLVLQHSARENYSLPNLNDLSRHGFVRHAAERSGFQHYAHALRIKLAGPEQRAGALSGGNQQKIVLAKWLARQCDVLIFDEPTRGIDVGAKYEIYLLMNQLVAEGKAILMISSELPEVLGMADRILVMHGGRVTGEVCDVKSTTQEEIMRLAMA